MRNFGLLFLKGGEGSVKAVLSFFCNFLVSRMGEGGVAHKVSLAAIATSGPPMAGPLGPLHGASDGGAGPPPIREVPGGGGQKGKIRPDRGWESYR